MLVQSQKLLLNCIAQLTEVCSAQCAPHRHEDVGTGLNQDAFIDGHENFSVLGGLVGQDARHERRDTIHPVREESK